MSARDIHEVVLLLVVLLGGYFPLVRLSFVVQEQTCRWSNRRKAKKHCVKFNAGRLKLSPVSVNLIAVDGISAPVLPLIDLKNLSAEMKFPSELLDSCSSERLIERVSFRCAAQD